ncbi:hypothetical protein [Nocardia sp. NRRL S-836]|uniref:hypothetical protein n=1 Tax=Nocardia sp. NRRL S-836 TaxID=1519492 RepID=UPI0006AFB775|nr:hypothetical protein [Nocardia sp. NRRL S-836]KOV84696.1 hypothetical protein ADL03_15600 [Nocardia sp. NRRL S-836]
MTSDRVADPNTPVLQGPQEIGAAFAEWFVNASPDEVHAFIAANGTRTKELKDRGELVASDKPRTWDGDVDQWSARTPSEPSPRTR